MQQDEVIIKSQKSQAHFLNFKKGMLISSLLAIPCAFFPFVICGFDADEIANISGMVTFFIILSLLWVTYVSIYYWKKKSQFENVEWIVTQAGITQVSKDNGMKTFIPQDHITSISLDKATIKITTIDLTHPQELAFLSNATEMTEAINTLIYTTETNKNITITQTTAVADEIAKYKQLFDQGIITQEEYEAKKKQLLGL